MKPEGERSYNALKNFPAEVARETTALLLLGLDMHITGRESLQGLPDGNVIYAFYPHTSHLDAMALRKAVPACRRGRLIAAAAADYWHQGGLASFGSLVVNSFPMTRDPSRVNDMGKSIRDAVKHLTGGYSLIIAPEGTRDGDGTLKPGVAELALLTNATIVPVFLSGFGWVMPKGAAFPRFFKDKKRSKVTVAFGAPIPVSREALPANKHEAKAEIMDRLKQGYDTIAKSWKTNDTLPNLPPAGELFLS